MWCRCINSLHNVFTYWCLKKETCRINYNPKICQNAALRLIFEQSVNWMLDALSDCKQLMHGLSGQCLCEVARSLANPLDICIWQAEPWWRASIWRSHRKVVIKQCSYHNNIIDIQNRLPYSKVVYPAIIVLFSCLMEVNHGVRTGPDYPFR